jgi:hypothetical protein
MTFYWLAAAVVFAALTTGLWRERGWAVHWLAGLVTLSAVYNLVQWRREGGNLEAATVVSYLSVVPALLFMSYRAARAGRSPARSLGDLAEVPE